MSIRGSKQTKSGKEKAVVELDYESLGLGCQSSTESPKLVSAPIKPEVLVALALLNPCFCAVFAGFNPSEHLNWKIQPLD